MNIESIVELVQNVGVMAVVLGCCMWYVKYRDDKNDAKMEALNEKHKIEMDNITTAVNNNTQALIKLCERMERDT